MNYPIADKKKLEKLKTILTKAVDSLLLDAEIVELSVETEEEEGTVYYTVSFDVLWKDKNYPVDLYLDDTELDNKKSFIEGLIYGKASELITKVTD